MGCLEKGSGQVHAEAYISKIKTQNFQKVGEHMQHMILNKHASCSYKFQEDWTIGGALTVKNY